MLRSKILQMRLEHREQKIDIVCRLRNFENAFVTLFARHGGFVLARIPERDSHRQVLCDEINCCQTHRALLQKTTGPEKQRPGPFYIPPQPATPLCTPPRLDAASEHTWSAPRSSISSSFASMSG